MPHRAGRLALVAAFAMTSVLVGAGLAAGDDVSDPTSPPAVARSSASAVPVAPGSALPDGDVHGPSRAADVEGGPNTLEGGRAGTGGG